MACSKHDKKRKVDTENREFKKEWTDNYAFDLPVGSTKPMCLICKETVALVKRGACLCSHSPILPQPYVPTFLRAFSKLGLMFPQPNVPTALYSHSPKFPHL